jgi:hypothetical protein
MPDPPDLEYYLKRARQEREREAAARDEAIAAAHRKLAEEYERRAGLDRPAMSPMPG